ncbi:MAG: acetate/propionate family kinase [Candidatus Dojkabacteria bacterium]
MSILAINSGSSSLKFKLYKSQEGEVIASGEIKSYSESSVISTINGKEEFLDSSKWTNRFEVLRKSLEGNEVDFVLHRIVHGGELYVLPIMLTDEVVEKMKEDLFDLAPLHNPSAFEILNESLEVYKEAKQIALFDSSFGLTIPEVNFLYGLPYEYYQKYKIRRYAFHGLSHKYVSKSYLNHISDDENIYSNSNSQEETLEHIRIVSLHLGSGCSTCAIKGTQCVDTSFGFTPEENLVMATRVGEIDYTAINYIKMKENLSDKDISDILNKKSGLLGLSGYTKDMKTIVNDYNSNPRAKLALDVFINSVVKQTFDMAASLNGMDILIFTGGIGQVSDIVRRMVCERLGILGVYIDVDKNVDKKENNGILNVSRKDSSVQIVVVPTDEEREMLDESKNLIM